MRELLGFILIHPSLMVLAAIVVVLFAALIFLPEEEEATDDEGPRYSYTPITTYHADPDVVAYCALERAREDTRHAS